MAWTKRDTIKKAFSRVGLASYSFTLTADELQSSMEVLDAMMAEWTVDGIVFDPVYPQPATISAGALTDPTNAPDGINNALYLNLGLRLADEYGKSVSQLLSSQARNAYNSALVAYIPSPNPHTQGMPKGAGFKNTINPFFEE